MRDASAICVRLMSAADDCDPGYMTETERGFPALCRSRDKAAGLRHLADLAREYRDPDTPRMWSDRISTSFVVDGWIYNHGIPLSHPIMHRPAVPWRQILAEVAAEYGVTVDDMTGPYRTQIFTLARQKAMWRMRRETRFSLPQIGARLGGKDHSTVHHGIRKHQARIDAGEA